MHRNILTGTITLLLLLTPPLIFAHSQYQAQAQSWRSSETRSQQPRYLPNTLVVKFEDEETLGSIRLKSGTDPKQDVREFLTPFGAGSMKPVWPESKSSPRRKRSGSGPGGSGSFASDDPAAELRRIFTVRYIGDADPAFLASKVSAIPGVEYAEPKYIRYLQAATNDPVSNEFEQYHRFIDAWDIETGSRDVVIAIVDAGVGYTHGELKNKIWINEDEIPAGVYTAADQNGDGNGTLTPAEIEAYLVDNSGDHNGNGKITLRDALHIDSPFTTGSDSDGNGFDDDIFGWDFWSSGGFNGSEVQDDNNPILFGTDHGTHVAGIAAADTDNSTGIAGAGFNSVYMPVKVGGVANNPSTPGNESLAIGFGFEGILYAAENDADIINCSWGGGEFSEAENDIIDFVTAMGSLVIGAAGNSGADEVIYPAGYTNALAVGSVETTGSIADYSHYGYKLDVLATGTGVRSVGCQETNNPGPDCTFQYEEKVGTSMSVPIVSGLAALIRAQHPGWSPQRIAGQIRSTAIPLNTTDPSLQNRLGKGRINAETALGTPMPAVRIDDFSFVNGEGLKLGLREDGEFRFTLRNHGAGTGNISVRVTALNDAGLELTGGDIQAGGIATDGETDFSISLRITDDFDTQREAPQFLVEYSDGGSTYTDFGVVEYDNLLYDVMDHNAVKMSMAADGTIGFTNALSSFGGVGFVPRKFEGGQYVDGDNMLFEGGLIIEANGEIYDAVRQEGGGISRDFNAREVFRLEEAAGAQDAQTGRATFIIGEPDNPVANIDLTAYAFDDGSRSNVVYARYEVENPSTFYEIEDMYLGLFNDWDIGTNVGNNAVEFSEADSILYLYDQTEGSTQPYVAVAHLGAFSSALAIDNASENFGYNFGLYDGFTEGEKSRSLTAGTNFTSVSGTDASAVVASGPFTLGARAKVSVGFVYAFGNDLDELRSQIQEARANVPFTVSGKGRAVFETPPQTTEVFQNYPNPFNPTTRIRLDLAQPSDVNLAVYNVLGRKVAELANGQLEAQIHIFKFDATNLSSGLYFARLTTDDRVRVLKMVLVK